MIVTSISAAASTAVAGDTILIWGMVDPNGNGLPVAYSDQAFFPGQANEVFPIGLKEGVSLRPAPSSPLVFVASEAATAPNALLSVVSSGSPSSALTTIKGIALLGGKVGLQLDLSSAGATRNVLVPKVAFDRNGTAASMEVTGGATLVASIEDCRIQDLADTAQFANPAIKLQLQTIGLHIQVELPGVVGTTSRADVTVNNLTLSGNFDNMLPAEPDIFFGSSSIPYQEQQNGRSSTRLIEALCLAGTTEHGPGSPSVDLTVTGCQLDGRTDSALTTGWDWAVYSSALGDLGIGSSSFDYSTRFDTTITGCTFEDFEKGCIYAAAMHNCRGLVTVNGGTVLRDSGSHLTSGSKPYLHSGVYLEAYEAYLGFVGFKMRSTGHLGNGLFAFSDGALGASSPYDTGLYLGLEACEIDNNTQAGIEMRVSDYLVGESPQVTQQAAIVGGTWNLGRSLIEEGNEPMSGVIPIGQGAIDRCKIHDNGGAGILANIQKTLVALSEHSICSRLTNSFLWNNDGGGFVANLKPKSTNPSDPLQDRQAMPSLYFGIVNNTFVKNGDLSSDYSIEVVDIDGTGAPLQGNYEWQENLSSGGVDHLRTRLLNTIFDRDGAGANDFGPNLDQLLVKDEDLPLIPVPPTDRIGAAGLRGEQGFTPLNLRFEESTSDAAPYAGGAVVPDRWFLDSMLPTFNSFDNTPDAVSVPVPEIAWDYNLQPRPNVTTGDIDKGADQS